MTRAAQKVGEPEFVDGPAKITPDHAQDRPISKEAGAPLAYRKRDGLAWMIERRDIHRGQYQAGRQLQRDRADALDALFPRSRMERGSASGRASDVPDKALEAKGRFDEAMAVLTPELVSMTALFLFPDFEEGPPSWENIAVRVREDKRAVKLGVRVALSLLARHYGT